MSFEFMETINRHLDEKRYMKKENPKAETAINIMGVIGWILFVWFLIR